MKFGKIIPNMSLPSPATQALLRAVARLLKPLVRLLLRNAVPFGAFQELARRAYVEVAMEADFAIAGKKPTISHASVITGLTRKDVQRLLTEDAAGTPDDASRYNRAARVLTAWSREPDFLDARGRPRALRQNGEGAGFAELVRRYSGDMPVRSVLDELLRVGAVHQRTDGCLVPVQRAYVPKQDASEKLEILGTDVAALIDTIDHNLRHGATEPRFQRKVLYHAIGQEHLAAFRKLSAAHSQALLEKLDAWLAARDVPLADAPNMPRVRIGLGIYGIEEHRGVIAPARRHPS